MSSSDKTSEVTEEDKMEVSNSADENKDKAGSQPEVPNLETALQVNQARNSHTRSEKTSEAVEENKMEVSNSAKENKDEAEKQPEMSKRGSTPFPINQAKNTPPDNLTPMDTSEPKNKTTRQNPKSGKETKRLKVEGTKKILMKCPNCQAEISPSVTFRKEKNDQCEFNIGLHQDNGDVQTTLFANTIGFTEPAGNPQKNECLHCNQSIIYKSLAGRNNKMGGFDIELSINISKEDHLQGEAMGRTQSQNGNYNEEMVPDDMNISSSETSTGCKTQKSSKQRDGNTVISKSSESKKSSSKTHKQSNQTTDSGGSSFVSHLSSIFQSPTLVMKVHYTLTSDTFGADAAIINQLKNNLKSSVHLEKTPRENCSIIIVFCPVSRSYESEVKSAMEKERVSSSGKPFILVLMHHTRDLDYSTAGCDASEVLKNVSYVHVFYHETKKGLLKCPQNEQAIKTIEKKLKTHKQ